MAGKILGGGSEKHEKINTENAKIVTSVGVAAFVVIFAMFSMNALIRQSLYQGDVIAAKEETLEQLKENVDSFEVLKNQYESFVSARENVIAGAPDGEGANSGDNAKIVLDALPGEYDYPGLASSLEKLLLSGPYVIDSIGGTEDGGLSGISDSTRPIEIPYPISVQASPDATKNLLDTLERSIRPFYVDQLTIRSNQSGLRTSIGLRTYFQPSVDYKLGSKVVQ